MKRLMISIPTAPFGSYHQELVWWLMAVQVQSACRDLAHNIADKLPTSQLKARGEIREMGDDLGVGYMVEQANRHWIDARTQKKLWAPMIPPGWTVTFCPVPGAPLDANRNAQVKHFLFDVDHDSEEFKNTDYDAVLLIDADNVPDNLDLHLLLEDIERDDVDVVGGVYCVENAIHGPQPLVYEMRETGEGHRFASKEVVAGERGLKKLAHGGLPTGCLLIKRHVFEKIYEARRSWFKNKLRDGSFENYEIHELLQKHKDDPAALVKELEAECDKKYRRDHSLQHFGDWAIGEDIWFCKMVHELGMSVWIDTRVFWGHIKLHDNKHEFSRADKICRRLFKAGAQAVDPNLTPRQSDKLFETEMQRSAIFADSGSGV